MTSRFTRIAATGALSLASVLGGATLTAAAPAGATASSTVTAYTTGPTHVRSGPSTSTSIVATLKAGVTITGTKSSNGWITIASPSAYAGKYIYAPVLTTTKPGGTTPPATSSGTVAAYAGYTVTYTYTASHARSKRIATHSQVSGDYVNKDWFEIASGPYAGQYMQNTDLVFDAPGSSAGSTQPSSVAPDGETVTRYALSNDFSGAVRSAPTTHSTLMARIKSGTAVTGHYVNNGTWFAITSGTYSGKYIASARIFAKNSMLAYNGQMPSADLWTLPSWANDPWNPSMNRPLACGAEKSFEEMNAAFRAKFGYDLQVDEGYRDLLTQQQYIKFLGYPRAAYPGTSNHGLGAAVDFEGSTSGSMDGHGTRYYCDTAAEQWLKTNAVHYGWQRPAYMDKGGINPEWWHYNYIG